MNFTDRREMKCAIDKLIRRGYVRHNIYTFLVPDSGERFTDIEENAKKFGCKILTKKQN